MWGKYRFGSLEVLWTDIDPFCSASEILREILGHERYSAFFIEGSMRKHRTFLEDLEDSLVSYGYGMEFPILTWKLPVMM